MNRGSFQTCGRTSPRGWSATPVLAFVVLLVFILLVAQPVLARQQSQNNSSPGQTLASALSAACRQDAQGFSRFLLAESRRSFVTLPVAEQNTFLKRFSLTSKVGKPQTLLDAQNRTVVRCATPAETVIFGLNPPQVDRNVAFIPVTVTGGETTNFGLVHQPDGWHLFSLGLLVINVPALVKQWEEAQLRANEQMAVTDLIAIQHAVMTYQSGFGQWPNAIEQLGPAPANQVSPEHAQLLPERVASGTADGYRFRYRVVTDSHGQIQGFELGAVPEQYGKTGQRSFFLDTQGKLHAADRKGAPATDDDPLITPPSPSSR